MHIRLSLCLHRRPLVQLRSSHMPLKVQTRLIVRLPPLDVSPVLFLLGGMRFQILLSSSWTSSHSARWFALYGNWNVADRTTGGGTLEAMA